MKALHRQMMLSGVLLGGLLLVSQAASAASTWTSIATVCVVNTSNAGHYSLSGGTFTYTGTSTASLGARCNVTNPTDSGASQDGRRLRLVIKIPTAPGST